MRAFTVGPVNTPGGLPDDEFGFLPWSPCPAYVVSAQLFGAVAHRRKLSSGHR